MKIQNLAKTTKDGKINGAMSPMIFLSEMNKQAVLKCKGIARVHFDDDRTLQKWDMDGYTGYDHLVLMEQYADGVMAFYLFVDTGLGGIPVAMKFSNDKEKPIFTPVYEKNTELIKPSLEEIIEIFDRLKAHPELIVPADGRHGYTATKIVNGVSTDVEHTFKAWDADDAKHWVINHLDCSFEWDVNCMIMHGGV